MYTAIFMVTVTEQKYLAISSGGTRIAVIVCCLGLGGAGSAAIWVPTMLRLLVAELVAMNVNINRHVYGVSAGTGIPRNYPWLR